VIAQAGAVVELIDADDLLFDERAYSTEVESCLEIFILVGVSFQVTNVLGSCDIFCHAIILSHRYTLSKVISFDTEKPHRMTSEASEEILTFVSDLVGSSNPSLERPLVERAFPVFIPLW